MQSHQLRTTANVRAQSPARGTRFSPDFVRLFSCIRRDGDHAALRSIPNEIFIEERDRRAFQWLREYVSRHGSFPGPAIVQRHLRMTMLITLEPLSYYLERAKHKTI